MPISDRAELAAELVFGFARLVCRQREDVGGGEVAHRPGEDSPGYHLDPTELAALQVAEVGPGEYLALETTSGRVMPRGDPAARSSPRRPEPRGRSGGGGPSVGGVRLRLIPHDARDGPFAHRRFLQPLGAAANEDLDAEFLLENPGRAQRLRFVLGQP